MTRTIPMRTGPDQTFAIDAETLHKQPALLNRNGKRMDVWLRGLDTVAYLLCLLGVIGSLSTAWWLFAPGLAACVLMLAANRKTAGEIARRRAQRSVDEFRHLHEIGAMWLVQS